MTQPDQATGTPSSGGAEPVKPIVDDADAATNRKRLHLREVSLTGTETTETYDGIGAQLGAARLALGLDLDRAALELRIRRSYIEAIESGRFDALPGQAYTQGFVRSYASFLRLDPEDILERLREETRARRKSDELVFPTPMAEARLPGLRVLALSLLIAGVVYVGWAMSNWEPSVSERIPPVPDNLVNRPTTPPAPSQPTSVNTAPGIVADTVPPAPVLPKPDRPPATPAPAVSAPPSMALVGPAYLDLPTLPAIAVSDTPSLVSAPVLFQPTAQTNKTPDTKPVDGAKSHVFGATDPSHIVIKANADTWIKVDEPGGNGLLRRVLRAGDSYNVPDRSDLIMSLGSAGAVEILIDGETAPSLGNTGEMRQKIPLDSDVLKRGLPKPARPSKSVKKTAPMPETDAAPAEPAAAEAASPAGSTKEVPPKETSAPTSGAPTSGAPAEGAPSGNAAVSPASTLPLAGPANGGDGAGKPRN